MPFGAVVVDHCCRPPYVPVYVRREFSYCGWIRNRCDILTTFDVFWNYIILYAPFVTQDTWYCSSTIVSQNVTMGLARSPPLPTYVAAPMNIVYLSLIHI